MLPFQELKNRINNAKENIAFVRASLEEVQREAQGEISVQRFLERLQEVEHLLDSRSEVVIGVVGQIKSGKSTLLNAIFFEGECTLPVAASPHTARLTCIRKGASRKAIVHFYTKEEWEQIESEARAGELRSTLEQMKKKAKEMISGSEVEVSPEEQEPTVSNELRLLVEEAEARLGKKGIAEVLQQGKKEIGFHELDDYVSAKGNYAYVVKCADLYLPAPELDGVMVVDTPGTNDPIEARERETLRFLERADAVLFCVSPGVRFLDSNDLHLIFSQLRIPLEAGAVVVAATKMDSLSEREYGEWKRMKAEAQARVLKFLEERPIYEGFIEQLRSGVAKAFSEENIVEISALMYEIGQWLAKKVSPSPRRVEDLQYHARRIAEALKIPSDPKVFIEKSGCEQLRQVLNKKILQRKEEIVLSNVKKRLKAIVEDVINQLQRKQEDVQLQVEALGRGIEEYRRNLERRKQDYEKLLEKMEEFKIMFREESSERRENLPYIRFSQIRAEVSIWGHTSSADVVVSLQLQLRRRLPEVIRQLKDEVREILSSLEVSFNESLRECGLSEKDELWLRKLAVDEKEAAMHEIEEELSKVEDTVGGAVRELPSFGFFRRLFSRSYVRNELQREIDQNVDRAEKQVNDLLRDTYEKVMRHVFDRFVGEILRKINGAAQRAKKEMDELNAAISGGEQKVKELTKRREILSNFCQRKMADLGAVLARIG